MNNEQSTPRPNDTEAPELRDYLGVLRRRKWTIALVVALVVGSTIAFSVRQTPIYESTVRVLVKPINPSQAVQGVSVESFINLDTEQGLVESPIVARLAGQALGGETQPSVLLHNVSVSVPANTQFLDITYSSPDRRVAAGAAQAIAQAYLEFRRKQASDAFATAARGYERQIQRLQTQLGGKQQELAAATVGSSEAAALQAEINALTSQIAILQAQVAPLLAPSVDPGEIVSPAVVPISPSIPNYPRNLALALTVGLILGVGIAFLRERLDDRLAGREEFEEVLGAPVLGIVPKRSGRRKRNRTELSVLQNPKTSVAEAYRTVRTNLQHLARNRGLRIFTVTSPMLGDGKTTVTANLAVALAKSGKRVMAISCDLHRPRLHRFFELDNTVGLTSVLTGQASLGDAVRRVGSDTLLVLPSGPTAANPTELLGSDEMERLLTELRGTADFVILDTPPIGAVGDALILAPKTDGVLLVADATSTARGAVAFARIQIEQVGGKIVGGIYHKFDPARARTYHPYYQRYYSGRYLSNGESDRKRRRVGRRAMQARNENTRW
jgi:capsular exopolysaccharide synthesis family protein